MEAVVRQWVRADRRTAFEGTLIFGKLTDETVVNLTHGTGVVANRGGVRVLSTEPVVPTPKRTWRFTKTREMAKLPKLLAAELSAWWYKGAQVEGPQCATHPRLAVLMRQTPPNVADTLAGAGVKPQPLKLRARCNILSVDLEHWEPDVPCTEAARYLMKVFAERRTRATFFALGSVTEDVPNLIRESGAGGHEIASHGWSHRPLYRLTPARLRDEIDHSREVLGRLAGSPSRVFVRRSSASPSSIRRIGLWIRSPSAACGMTAVSSRSLVPATGFRLSPVRRSADLALVGR